jgi:chromosome segregation ATPase
MANEKRRKPVSEIQKIYDQLVNVMSSILSLYGERERIRETIKDLNAQIAAREIEIKKTQELFQNHLQNEPQAPERSDFSDKARYNEELARYNRAFSAWSAERDRIEGLLESLKAAIPILKQRIEEKNERLRELEIRVSERKERAEELIELAYKLASEAPPEEKASIEAVLEEIDKIKYKLFGRQEVSRETATRTGTGEELPARIQSKPELEIDRPSSLPKGASRPIPADD